MKKLICVVLAAAVFAAIADEPPPFDLKKKPQTEEEKAARKAYIEDRFNKHTGGRLIVPGSLKGKFVYVNAQHSFVPLKYGTEVSCIGETATAADFRNRKLCMV